MAGAFDESAAIAELLGEIKLLRSDMTWVRSAIDTQAGSQLEIFERLRAVEQDLAAIKAGQAPRMSGWAMLGIIGSVAVAILVILDRIYINQ